MTLKDARALRDYIVTYGYHSTVPLGHGPDRYTPRIFGAMDGCGALTFLEFESAADFRRHHAMRLRERRRVMRSLLHAPPRSAIEMMIDQACGL